MAIVAVSVDPPETSAKLKQELHLPFPLLSDRGAAVIKQYGLLHSGAGEESADIARPADLLLDASGTIRWAAFTENFTTRTTPDVILAAADTL